MLLFVCAASIPLMKFLFCDATCSYLYTFLQLDDTQTDHSIELEKVRIFTNCVWFLGFMHARNINLHLTLLLDWNWYLFQTMFHLPLLTTNINIVTAHNISSQDISIVTRLIFNIRRSIGKNYIRNYLHSRVNLGPT